MMDSGLLKFSVRIPWVEVILLLESQVNNKKMSEATLFVIQAAHRQPPYASLLIAEGNSELSHKYLTLSRNPCKTYIDNHFHYRPVLPKLPIG